MPSADFQLVVITPPTFQPAETAVVQRLFEAGLPTLHLRKPGATAAELAAYFDALPSACHGRIVLHAHYELARQYEVKGLHLPAAVRAAGPSVQHLLRPGRTLSTSLHSLPELLQHRRRYDYVFLSPVFDSTSKPGYAAAFQLDEVAATLTRLNQVGTARVLALGGITPHNIDSVRQAGFDGAAVLGYVWQAADPVTAWQQLVRVLAPV